MHIAKFFYINIQSCIVILVKLFNSTIYYFKNLQIEECNWIRCKTLLYWKYIKINLIQYTFISYLVQIMYCIILHPSPYMTQPLGLNPCNDMIFRDFNPIYDNYCLNPDSVTIYTGTVSKARLEFEDLESRWAFWNAIWFIARTSIRSSCSNIHWLLRLSPTRRKQQLLTVDFG